MKIVIVGAGDVGRFLCKVLSEDGHAVTLVESDDEAASDVEENLDVRVVRGNGASAKCLTTAGAQTCEYFLAMTDHDQLNLAACAIAAKLGARKTVARVHDLVYVPHRQRLCGNQILALPRSVHQKIFYYHNR